MRVKCIACNTSKGPWSGFEPRPLDPEASRFSFERLRPSRNFKNRSCKRGHKLDGIGVERIRTFPFSSDSAYNSVAYDPVKTILSESQAEAQEQTNHSTSSHSL